MTEEAVRTMIVDDEPQARKGLQKLLGSLPAFTYIGEARNGLEAISLIPRLQPQLLLLDIQMPEINGFEVLQSIPPAARPLTIFITAYDSYAIQAFEIHAIDYILKPFTDARFFAALERARQQVVARQSARQQDSVSRLLSQWVQEQATKPDTLIHEVDPLEKRLLIKHEGAILFLEYEEIRWVEAYDYYIKIHVAGRFYLVRKSLKRMIDRLPGKTFLRVHKSALINLRYIKRLEPGPNGTFLLHLQEGQQIKVSKGYSRELLNRLDLLA